MSGYGYAGFICGARDCYESTEGDLISDGWYPTWGYLEDWHIELPTTDWTESGIVRCPKHCEFIDGHWEDLP